MSEWRVQVVEVGKIGKHPNADTLSISHVMGNYPVIFRTGDYQTGDKAVYVPVDSIVPSDDPRWDFLDNHRKIKAKKLRGIFSMGLLTPADPAWEVGQLVHEELRIEKYEPPPLIGGVGENESCPFHFPVYTDIEGYRKYGHMLEIGEEVVLTEKIHGTNARFVWHGDRLWVGSHKCIKKEGTASASNSIWWTTAKQYGLEELLSQHPDIVLYGEIYGYVQDLKYGLPQGHFRLAVFDALDLRSLKHLDYDDLVDFVKTLNLPMVPLVYRGPWDETLISTLSNGKSTLADHVREGFVGRPVKERWNDEIGRVILKYVGEDYLLRKEGTK